MAELSIPPTLRFASYNIRKARGLDGQRNPGRILDVLNELGADVIALQEADRRLGDRPAALPFHMIETDTDFEVLPTAQNDVSLGWHGNAILLRKGIEAAGVKRIDLPGLEPRGAVYFEVDLGPLSVAVMGAHLGLMRRHRRLQLERLATQVQDVDDAIILGDFNEWSARRGLEPLTPKFTVLSPGQSFHAARPVAALDRIAHSSAIKVADAGVDQGKLAKLASDHLPIWADLMLPRPSLSAKA
ncbi:endonuclease/exonuclease/phosphatase family protein [uncultured Tateyamaria sp.]|uniref:endonuclease/exonuclease/phosphatase family protein n=1 Tax=uncultured Tateyamaria sp. TaxID=455651 RepID=UPI002607CD50|nr:endonuclease/exonuclease/phosphatase family protein [uncultured Tateyamaria sp.]